MNYNADQLLNTSLNTMQAFTFPPIVKNNALHPYNAFIRIKQNKISLLEFCKCSFRIFPIKHTSKKPPHDPRNV